MSQVNNGGPAFPVTPTDRGGQCAQTECGMTLRDYFAAKAMIGELCSQSEKTGYYTAVDKLARNCYQIADAMIAARASQQEQP